MPSDPRRTQRDEPTAIFPKVAEQRGHHAASEPDVAAVDDGVVDGVGVAAAETSRHGGNALSLAPIPSAAWPPPEPIPAPRQELNPPPPPPPAVVPVGPSAKPGKAPEPTSTVIERIVGGVLCILAALTIGFVAEFTIIGAAHHSRAQDVEFADLRDTLAHGTAPVGAKDMNRHLLAPGAPMALLEARDIGLREVIGEGTTGGILANGPGHRRDTVFPGQAGNSVVMGRRAGFGGPFARIADLHRGDTITVTTGQGKSTFSVLDVRHAGDPQPAVLASGQGRLTLVTADGPPFVPTDVVRVDASLTSAVQETPAQVIPSSGLPDAEKAMAPDFGVLMGLVLWGQALLAAAFIVVWIRLRVGRWHGWVIGVPVLGALGISVASHIAPLLPNLM